MKSTTLVEIENAGLVLLAPFLPHFFRILGYLNGMRFTDEATHAKAVCLLRYMADQKYDAVDDPGLSALLCGWPVDRPLLSVPVLSDGERRQADLVMEAMRSHWTALGDRSSDEMRRLFLKRQGMLEVGMEPVLTVLAQPQDWLLKELPWVYAVTRTPWCEAITVHWER